MGVNEILKEIVRRASKTNKPLDPTIIWLPKLINFNKYKGGCDSIYLTV